MKRVKQRQKRQLTSQEGFSVFSLLLATGVSALILVSATSYVRQSNVIRETSRFYDGKNAVYHMLNQYGSLAASLRNSLSLHGNEALKACVLNFSCPTTATDLTFEGPFPGSAILAGPLSSPIPYDSWGVACGLNRKDCPFNAASQFIGACSTGTGCVDSVQLLFYIKDQYSKSNVAMVPSLTVTVPFTQILAVAYDSKSTGSMGGTAIAGGIGGGPGGTPAQIAMKNGQMPTPAPSP